MVADLVNYLVFMGEPARAARVQIGYAVLIVLGVLFVWSTCSSESTGKTSTNRREQSELSPMMTLYSGTTCPFSQRCRIVLYEKGMDFQIVDVDLYNKPEDLAVMNPYNRVPVLVERDLILYESNIINEYIDDRFPHPQLMPADPVMRARARLFLFRFEQELFCSYRHDREGPAEIRGQGAHRHSRQPDADRAGVREAEVHAGGRVLDARRGHRAAALAAGLLRYPAAETGGAPDEVRGADLQPARVHRGADAIREGDAQVKEAPTTPYLIRAIWEWCVDNGFTPYIGGQGGAATRVPMEYVRNGEIVLNISPDATRNLKIGNELIQFSARFNGVSREVSVPVVSCGRDLRQGERPGAGIPAPRSERGGPTMVPVSTLPDSGGRQAEADRRQAASHRRSASRALQVVK